MAFSDPQTLVHNGNPIVFARTSFGPTAGGFSSPDGVQKLTISNAYGKRVRRQVRIDSTKNAADPLQPATNRPYSMSVYTVFDVPLFGYSATEQLLMVNQLTEWLTASSAANVAKVLNGEI